MSFEQDLRDAHKARHAKFFPPKAARKPKPAPKFEPPKLPTHKRVQIIAVSNSDEPSPVVVRTFTDDWQPTIREIRFTVCQHFGITSLELDHKGRTQDVVRRRQIAMHLCVKLTGYSMTFIGRKFGAYGIFDRSTVFHAHSKILQKRAASPDFDQEIQALEQQITRVPNG